MSKRGRKKGYKIESLYITPGGVGCYCKEECETLWNLEKKRSKMSVQHIWKETEPCQWVKLWWRSKKWCAAKYMWWLFINSVYMIFLSFWILTRGGWKERKKKDRLEVDKRDFNGWWARESQLRIYKVFSMAATMSSSWISFVRIFCVRRDILVCCFHFLII